MPPTSKTDSPATPSQIARQVLNDPGSTSKEKLRAAELLAASDAKRPQGRPPIDAAVMTAAVEAVAKGSPVAQVAASFGMTANTLHREVRARKEAAASVGAKTEVILPQVAIDPGPVDPLALLDDQIRELSRSLKQGRLEVAAGRAVPGLPRMVETLGKLVNQRKQLAPPAPVASADQEWRDTAELCLAKIEQGLAEVDLG